MDVPHSPAQEWCNGRLSISTSQGMTPKRALIIRYASSCAWFLDGPERTRPERLIRWGESL